MFYWKLLDQNQTLNCCFSQKNAFTLFTSELAMLLVPPWSAFIRRILNLGLHDLPLLCYLVSTITFVPEIIITKWEMREKITFMPEKWETKSPWSQRNGRKNHLHAREMREKKPLSCQRHERENHLTSQQTWSALTPPVVQDSYRPAWYKTGTR